VRLRSTITVAKIGALATSAATLTVLAASPAHAIGDVSISFTSTANVLCGNVSYAGETFTAPASGKVTSVQLAPYSASTVTRTLRLVAFPGRTVLSSQQVTVGNSSALLTFALPTPVAVTAGQTYGVDLSGACSDNLGVWGTTENLYPGGNHYDASDLFAGDVSFGVTVSDDVAPTLTIAKAPGQADPSRPSNGPIHFTATFSEPVTGFTSSDVVLSGAGTPGTSLSVTGGNTVFDIAVTPNASGGTSGAVNVSVPAGAALDLRNNASTASNLASVQYLAPQPQTVTFTSTAPSPAARLSTYQATASGGGSGNPVTFGTSTPAVCTVSTTGATTFDHAGTCTITANQAGNADYTPATQATQSVTVSKTAQTLTFTSTAPSPAARLSTYQATATGGGSGNPVTFGTSTPAVCTVSTTGATTFDHAGSCVITANQAGNADYAAAAQVAQPVTVSKSAQAIGFTSSPPARPTVGTSYVVTTTGGASGLPVTITATPDSVCRAGNSTGGSATVSFLGVGACTITATQPGSDDFVDATAATQRVSVAPAPDTTAPDTALVRAPKSKTHKRAAVFRFSSSEAGSHFECRVDGGPFKACVGPVKKKFKPGKHVFEVRAIDSSGNVDPTPAVVRWRFVPLAR
jgi:hypothetical protein